MLLFGACTQMHGQIKTVIFDLEGVLVETSRSGIGTWMAGNYPFEMLWQYMQLRNPKTDIFAYMDHVYPHKVTQTTSYDPEGNPLPKLMHDWLAGVPGCESDTIVQWLASTIDEDTSLGALHKRAYKAVSHAIFNPAVRGANTHILPAGYNMLTSLKRKHTNCTFAILSNYDTQCYTYIRHASHTRPLFDTFDPRNICISSNLRCIKPNTQIYHTVCEKLGVEPNECLCIDDQDVNVHAAQKIGMHAVRFAPTHDDWTKQDTMEAQCIIEHILHGTI